MTSLLVSVVVAGVLACGGAQSATATTPARESFHSNALNRMVRYHIVVPASAATARVPVVYLLHGHGGEEGDWFTHSRATTLANQYNVAVVTPDGANSWYINGGSGRWGDYIADDLVREVERRWPVKTVREGRAVAGLSMGGYGAMNLALQHPERFALAASMSGALDIARANNIFEGERRIDQEVRASFGPPESATRRDNDIYRLAAEADASQVPYLHIDCGRDDPWFGVNVEFAQVLATRGITHDFQALPGNHNWRYWDRQIEVVLALAAQRLR
jgi:S-formylglutathione hydrolase FrmB